MGIAEDLEGKIMRSIPSNLGLSKKAIIYQVITDIYAEADFIEREMDQLYKFSIKYRNNSLSQEEFITQISNLRGRSMSHIIAALGIISARIMLTINQRPENHFGSGKGTGPRSLKVTGLTQNASSEKKEPLKRSYNYVEVMKELARQSSLQKQSNNKKIEIQAADQTYVSQNRYRQSADELKFRLAEEIYDSIRDCDTDICDIVGNLGFKADNIKDVKDHIFYLDQT